MGSISGSSTLLISIDGLRGDFVEFYGAEAAPNLAALAKRGVRARHVIPQFNTLTLPNHVSIATGLYAENHGFVSNCMYDPEEDDTWTSWDHMTESSCHLNADKARRWWRTGNKVPGSEPIWSANQRQNSGVSGVYAWPLGHTFSADKIAVPHYQSDYHCDNAAKVPFDERADTVVSWLTHPEKRANFVAAYFGDFDSAEHEYGIKDHRSLETLASIDAAIGRIVQLSQKRGLSLDSNFNIIITSDHGHVDLDVNKFVYLEQHIDKDKYVRKDCNFWPMGCSEDYLEEKLSRMPHVDVYANSTLQKYNYSKNHRIGKVVVMSHEAGMMLRHPWDFTASKFILAGMHGYSSDLPSMWPCLINCGPAFQKCVDLGAEQPVDQVDIIAACCHALRIQVPPGDASTDRIRHFLA